MRGIAPVTVAADYPQTRTLKGTPKVATAVLRYMSQTLAGKSYVAIWMCNRKTGP